MLETVNIFRNSRNNYKDNEIKLDTAEYCMGRHSYGKLTLTGYSSFLDDAYITERDKTDPTVWSY